MRLKKQAPASVAEAMLRAERASSTKSGLFVMRPFYVGGRESARGLCAYFV